jgi:branched-chain amino acid transport system ATP-binding protein
MLNIQELNVSYDDLPALRGVSLTVKKGSITSILGANGAGKTSLLRTISGLKPPVSGEVYFENQSINGIKPYQIAEFGIAHVPENRRIFSQLTVLENLELGSVVRKAKENRKEGLDYVFSMFPRLYERQSQKGATLSGGEQQMLAIGRGLMLQPKLLMLDEPSLGLAPIIVEEVFKLIEKIHNEGVTVLLVEQNAQATFGLMEYGFVLENGVIIQEGDNDNLLKSDFIKKSYLGLEV